MPIRTNRHIVGTGSKVDMKDRSDQYERKPVSSQAARNAMDRAIERAEQAERERLGMLDKPKGNC